MTPLARAAPDQHHRAVPAKRWRCMTPPSSYGGAAPDQHHRAVPAKII